MAQLDPKEKLALTKRASEAINKAKNKKGLRAVWLHDDYGYLILGHRVLGRLMAGKTIEEAVAGRGG